MRVPKGRLVCLRGRGLGQQEGLVKEGLELLWRLLWGCNLLYKLLKRGVEGLLLGCILLRCGLRVVSALFFFFFSWGGGWG